MNSKLDLEFESVLKLTYQVAKIVLEIHSATVNIGQILGYCNIVVTLRFYSTHLKGEKIIG